MDIPTTSRIPNLRYFKVLVVNGLDDLNVHFNKIRYNYGLLELMSIGSYVYNILIHLSFTHLYILYAHFFFMRLLFSLILIEHIYLTMISNKSRFPTRSLIYNVFVLRDDNGAHPMSTALNF